MYAWCYTGQIEPIFSRTRELVARHAQLLKRRAAAQLRRDVACEGGGESKRIPCVGLVLHRAQLPISPRTSELVILKPQRGELCQVAERRGNGACVRGNFPVV